MRTPKDLHRFKAIFFGLSSVILFFALYFSKVKSPAGLSPFQMALLASGFLAALSIYHLIACRLTSPDTRFYDISRQPPEEQITACRRIIWIMIIVCPLLAYYEHKEITDFETGRATRYRSSPPVVYVYKNVGKQAAVAFWPLFGVVVCTAAYFRIKKAKLVIRECDNSDQ